MPPSSLADFSALPFGTAISAKSAPGFPVEATPLTTALTGTFLDRATSSEVMLLKPKSNCPETTPGTIAAPPCASVGSSFSPRSP